MNRREEWSAADELPIDLVPGATVNLQVRPIDLTPEDVRTILWLMGRQDAFLQSERETVCAEWLHRRLYMQLEKVIAAELPKITEWLALAGARR